MSPTLWDPRAEKERADDVAARHSQARILCNRCPVLRACEARMMAHESEGLLIAGVVAARYSVLQVSQGSMVPRQEKCSGCGVLLHAPNARRRKKGTRIHAGEGLCTKCWPMLRRIYKGTIQ
ncbi:hypothetical protein [Corynebacterium sp. H127]|uniref:hypothetical protein n=1 Tax=Corynebacterium sp. H127 TaxID=3133418 RepID=UPI00403F2816